MSLKNLEWKTPKAFMVCNLFGQTLAVQVKEALAATGTDEVWEFGAGTGALALQLLDSLGDAVKRYTIIDLSGTLRARQSDTLLPHAGKVRWLDAWPQAIEGVVPELRVVCEGFEGLE